MEDIKQKKIEYQKPTILDLGEVTPAHGGGCASGNTAPGGPCSPTGNNANGGQCSVGTTRAVIGVDNWP